MYWADERSGLEHRSDLTVLLVVPARTPTLDADTSAMGLEWNDLGGGYWRVAGGLFELYVVELDGVTEHEDDDLVRLFSHSEVRTLETLRFLTELVGSKEAGMAVQDLEGYDEVVEKVLESIPPEQRLAGLAPEQVLATFAPEQRLAGLILEQRLAGLHREQMLLALPDEMLRSFSEDYLATFPEDIRLAVRKRLGR